MSKYTTGEIAKLCNVTVRTVQYYDTKGILIPSELTDGGRRLYSEKDLKKMKIICFLRDLDISINNIQDILKEENPDNVIELLLNKQQKELKEEIDEKQEKLNKLIELTKIISENRKNGDLDLDSIGDAAKIMTNKKALKKMRMTMILTLIPIEIIELAATALWIIKGIWWPFVIAVVLMIIASILMSKLYMESVKYICPDCHTSFVPKKAEMFMASHTPNTRKLTCPCCNKKRWCVEIYNDDLLKAKEA